MAVHLSLMCPVMSTIHSLNIRVSTALVCRVMHIPLQHVDLVLHSLHAWHHRLDVVLTHYVDQSRSGILMHLQDVHASVVDLTQDSAIVKNVLC